MKTYSIQSNIYATPEGVVTYDAAGGKNPLVLAQGAVISLKEAERLNLPALEEARRIKATEVADHLSELKPFADDDSASAESAPVPTDALETPRAAAIAGTSARTDAGFPSLKLSSPDAQSAAAALNEAASNAQKAADALTGAAGAETTLTQPETENQS